MDEFADIDHRPSLFVGFTPENLARHTATFPRTGATPATVANLLGDARRTFVGAATCYDNLASSAFKALQAAELALRVAMGETQSRTTLGQLLRRPDVETVLNATQLAWFSEFALHFRNRLAHPNDSMAMTPGMAEPFVRTAHVIVAELFPDEREP